MKKSFRPLSAAILGTAILASSMAITAPAQAASALPSKTATYQTYTANGVTSQYHIYTEGIDQTKPVGVLFVFHGDYSYPAQSYVHSPSGATMKAMAAEAAKKNMIMVPVVTPDKKGGITWWEDKDKNGDYFRSLASMLIKKYNLDTSRIWFHGYSGGAEFIAYEVLADRSDWIKGGGATIVGGGGTSGFETQPNAAVKKLNITWEVGAQDGLAGTTLATWSALASATKAEKFYRASGFTRTDINVIPNTGHYNYNMPQLLANGLRALPNIPTTSTTAVAKQGDIAAVSSDGVLYIYPSAKGGDLAKRTYVSSAYAGVKSVEINDWNADGNQDIIASWKNGKVTVDYGKAGGGFTRGTIGSGGWQSYDILTTNWVKGDKYPSIIAKNKVDGKLYVYSNPSGKGHGARTLIGSSGWKSMNLMATDYDKNGTMDLMAETTQGQIKLYRGNGKGKLVSETRKVIGKSGWNAMNHLSSIQNHTGNGNDGIVARDKFGKVYYYEITKNKINSRKLIGNGGWEIFNLGS